MRIITKCLPRLAREEDAGEVIEYALILGLIVVAAVAAIAAVGTQYSLAGTRSVPLPSNLVYIPIALICWSIATLPRECGLSALLRPSTRTIIRH